MDKVGEIIRRQERLNASTAMKPCSSQNLAWQAKLKQMSHDMKQVIVPGQLTHWAQELSSYEDQDIVEALGLYRGEFFPNVKQIKEIIERRKQAEAEQKRLGEWDRWKDEQRQAEADGKLATKQEIEQMVAGCRQAWERIVNGRNSGTKAHSSKGLAKAPATVANPKSA